MATKDEIEKLKQSWMKDPCWDIEDTEGFEEHRDDLRIFRLEQEVEWQREEEKRIASRARVIAIDTGIVNSTVAQSLHTYAEIDSLAKDRGNDAEQQSDLMRAQVHATLLLAAQCQRIAEALEEHNASDMGDSNLDFMTRLYAIK